MVTFSPPPPPNNDVRILCLLLGTLRNYDGDGKRQQAIGLISNTTTLQVHHAFLYISLPSLRDYDVK